MSYPNFMVRVKTDDLGFSCGSSMLKGYTA